MVLMALAGLTLSAPASVAACQCMGQAEGDVVFTGKVTESPNGAFLPELTMPQPGLYSFNVESVKRGDPRDGRVYSPGGTCDSVFEVGATYRVHARVVDPSESRAGNPPGVVLLTDSCMAGELLEGPPPLLAIRAWAFSFPGVLVVGAALWFGLLGAAWLWYSRRTSTDAPLAGSD